MRDWLEKICKDDLLSKDWGIRLYVTEALRMTNTLFKWDGLPDTIPERILEEWVQTRCEVIFGMGSDGQLHVFFGSRGAEPDYNYEPTKFIVNNPYLKNSEGDTFNNTFTIGTDCVLLRNDSYSQGLLPIISRYAHQMVENDISIYDAQVNMRIQSLIVATTDTAKVSAEMYLKRVEEGKTGIILSKGLTDETLQTKPFATAGTSNGLSQLIEMHQYLKASLLNELGINANFNMKRERINTAESELNEDALLPLIDDMLNQRKLACEKINAMFGTSITVEKASLWAKKEAEAEAETETEADEETEGGADDGENEDNA